MRSPELSWKLLPVYIYLLLVSSITQANDIANQSPLVKLSFSQAFEQLIDKNDALAAGRSNLQKAKFLQQAARDLYLPSVDVSATYTRLNEAVTVLPSYLLDRKSVV